MNFECTVCFIFSYKSISITDLFPHSLSSQFRCSLSWSVPSHLKHGRIAILFGPFLFLSSTTLKIAKNVWLTFSIFVIVSIIYQRLCWTKCRTTKDVFFGWKKGLLVFYSFHQECKYSLFGVCIDITSFDIDWCIWIYIMKICIMV